jgi:ribosomal RNA-processing protein 9
MTSTTNHIKISLPLYHKHLHQNLEEESARHTRRNTSTSEAESDQRSHAQSGEVNSRFTRRSTFVIYSNDLPKKMTEEEEVEVVEPKSKKAIIAEKTVVEATQFVKGHSQSVTACAFSHDDKWLASASKDGSVIQWDIETQGMVARFKAEDSKKAVRGVTFCDELCGGNVLVSCGEDKLVRIWDIRTPGECVKELRGHQGEVNAVRYAFDQSTGAGKLFTVGADKAVKVWYINGTDGKVFDSFYGHTSSVLCMDMMSIDRPITGGDDHAIRTWNLARDSHTLFSSGGHTAPVDSVYMLDATHYVSSGQDSAICLWGATSRKALARVEEVHGPDNWVTSVGGVRNSDLVFSGSNSGEIKFWRAGRPHGETSKKTKMVVEELETEVKIEGVVNEIRTSHSGNLVVAAIGKDHKHGRWVTATHAHNGLMFFKLNKNE